MTPSELRLRQVSHRGEVAEWTLNPLWTQLDREKHEEFGLLKLFLVSRGRKLAVAGFLSPKEKESFAAALSAALGEARRGPTAGHRLKVRNRVGLAGIPRPRWRAT